MLDYTHIITLEPGKRSGKPCIRGLRITVYDVLSYLAAGMSIDEILSGFPSLIREDVLACLSYAAECDPIDPTLKHFHPPTVFREGDT